MRYVYDTEIFKYDWLFIAKEQETGKYTVIHNDNEELIEFLNAHEDDIFIGFNSKHYDRYIVKGICNGYDTFELKELNDYLIGGGNGWEHPDLKFKYNPKFNNVDIMDDMMLGMSLKAIEGHLGMNIQESEVDFDLDRPLNSQELQSTIFYCKHDVDATEKVVELRKDYLDNKVNIGKLAGLDEAKALSLTNAKLTSSLLRAERVEHDDERKYVYPPNLKREYIPQEVFDFFNRMHDESISDDELFNSKLNIKIRDCEITLAYGGAHGAIDNYIEEATDDRVIINDDIKSFYPHLCTLYHYTSRNIPDPSIYEKVLEDRMKAKASGDKATAEALKLVVNTTYGAQLNEYNDLYDPLMARSVCISGQLFIVELLMQLDRNVSSMKIVQVNTDGIMISLNKDELDKAHEVMDEWQARTGFELEEDHIKKIVQKDVSNYIEVQMDDKVKIKGGYLVRGISKVGAFKVNNNAIVVAEALIKYFTEGTPIETTVNNCNDILAYQFIAKAGSKYDRAYQLVGDKEIPIQKVNRVYASKNKEYGKLYKVKASNGQVAKIEGLPEYCIIDNDNHLTIDDIDKQYYIDFAKKRLNDFLGIENKKGGKMAETTASKTKKTETKLNVWQKLNKARKMFLDENIQKSGFNATGDGFFYFELKDIVPAATKIFNEIGIAQQMYFTERDAYAQVHNCDDLEETPILFSIPFEKQEPIISRAGNVVTPKIQCMGSSVTYYRRYLWQLILDIIQQDEVDSTDTSVKLEKAQEAPKYTSPEQRAEITQELTNVEGFADALQVEGLKNVLNQLVVLKPEMQSTVDALTAQTKNFTNIKRADCEKLIQKFSALLEVQE